MQECRSSSMSRCLRAKWAVLVREVVEAERWVRRVVKRMRTSKGSAIVDFNGWMLDWGEGRLI